MYKVGQKVRVTQDHKKEDGLGWHIRGDILTIDGFDSSGYPYFDGESPDGWADFARWIAPITTPEPEIEVTQVRILGRLYNLVPVDGE